MNAVTLTTRERVAWLAAYWRPHRRFAAVLFLWTVFSSVVAVSFPLVWKQVVDGLELLPIGTTLGDNELGRFTRLLALIALGRLVVGFYPAFRAWMNLNIEKAVRERVFASILAKDHTFFGRFRTGDLITRLTDDIAEYPRIA
jgi:ATP-binding cassette subfamily B protein